MKKFALYFIFIILLSACQSAREGFSLKKKDNSDEFLVEKKNPLVMPPNYNKLPMPEDFQSGKKDNDEFKSVIKSNNNINKNSSKKKLDIEKSILEKIN